MTAYSVQNAVVLSDGTIINTFEHDENTMSAVTLATRNPANRIARLNWDVNNPERYYKWRDVDGKSNPPQTLVFNENLNSGKGSSPVITSWAYGYMAKPESNPNPRGWEAINIPNAGWKNTDANVCQAISFAGNDVLVIGEYGPYSRVLALDCFSEDWTDTFFTDNGRLLFHKATAANYSRVGAKDCFIPFMRKGESWWTLTSRLEPWPLLPFTLSTGVEIIYYDLKGDYTYGLSANGNAFLLESPDGFSDPFWKLKNRPVPEMLV